MTERSPMKPEHAVHFDVNTVARGHFKVTYKGIPAFKCPFDYVLYQMLIWQLKPDLIIEIGTHRGGAALYYADLLDQLGAGAVHTIDVVAGRTAAQVSKHPRIREFVDGYQGYDLDLARDYETVLVVEDGSHQYSDVLAVLHKFQAVVRVGSYMLVEDGILDALGKAHEYNGGPLRALDEFLAANPQFIVDRTWTDMFGQNATFNVNGYLKRVL